MSEKKIPRCSAQIYKRDTYRYSGRGRSGFSMHYNTEQCTRRATENGRCYQHQSDGFMDCKWAEKFIERDGKK